MNDKDILVEKSCDGMLKTTMLTCSFFKRRLHDYNCLITRTKLIYALATEIHFWDV